MYQAVQRFSQQTACGHARWCASLQRNIESPHFVEGAYDRIAVKPFNDLNVDTYYLEYDTPRAGGFEPLEHLPKHKNVILGVVTSKFPELADFDEMKRRVLQVAECVARGSGQTIDEALKRMGVSSQCGFASHCEGMRLIIMRWLRS